MSGLVVSFPDLIVLTVWTVAATSLLLWYGKWCFYKGYQAALDKCVEVINKSIQEELEKKIKELKRKLNEQ